MKQRSSYLFATWSFLSLHAAAALYIPGPPPQHAAPSPGLAQPLPLHEAAAPLSLSQSRDRRAQPRHPAQPLAETPSPFSPADPTSPLRRSRLDQVSPNNKRAARPRSAASPPPSTGVCTFTASQVQACTSQEQVNSLRISTDYEADRTVVAAVHPHGQQPLVQHDKMREFHAWNSASSIESRTLTILQGEDGHLSFTYGDATWSEMSKLGDGEAGWCEDSKWQGEVDDWSCPAEEAEKRRVSLPSF